MINPAYSDLEMSLLPAGTISGFERSDGQIVAAVLSDMKLGIESSTPMRAGNFLNQSEIVTLKNGAVLLAPAKDRCVKTSFGTIKMAAGSLVLILSFASGIAVYDLDDTHQKAVTVSTANKQFQLYPGMNIVISNSEEKTFEQINPAQRMAYRNIVETQIGRGQKVFSTEFSVPGALQFVHPLKQLLNSNNQNAKRITEHLIKTTAARMQVQNKGTGFQQMIRPTATACAIELQPSVAQLTNQTQH
jgi:hypothetical protein